MILIDGIDKFQSVALELKDKHSVSRTARYWFQYMDYIQVVKMFIYTERAGDWNLHLHTICKMCLIYPLQQGIYAMRKVSECIYSKCWIYHSNIQTCIASL